MSKNKKPREFWVEDFNNGEWITSTCWKGKLDLDNLIHVREVLPAPTAVEIERMIEGQAEYYSLGSGDSCHKVDFTAGARFGIELMKQAKQEGIEQGWKDCIEYVAEKLNPLDAAQILKEATRRGIKL